MDYCCSFRLQLRELIQIYSFDPAPCSVLRYPLKSQNTKHDRTHRTPQRAGNGVESIARQTVTDNAELRRGSNATTGHQTTGNSNANGHPTPRCQCLVCYEYAGSLQWYNGIPHEPRTIQHTAPQPDSFSKPHGNYTDDTQRYSTHKQMYMLQQ